MTREEAELVAAVLVTVDPVPEGYRVRRGRYVSFRVSVSGREADAFYVCTLHATNASRIQRRWWTWCESIGTCPYSGAIWGRVSSACGMGGIGAGVKWGRMRSGGRCHD